MMKTLCITWALTHLINKSYSLTEVDVKLVWLVFPPPIKLLIDSKNRNEKRGKKPMS